MRTVKSNDNNHRMQQLLSFLEATPNDCFLLHALALENSKIENFTEAENIFEKVLSINPQYVGSYYHLAKLQEQNGKQQKAISTYQEGIKMAQLASDFHAVNELRNALDELLDNE